MEQSTRDRDDSEQVERLDHDDEDAEWAREWGVDRQGQRAASAATPVQVVRENVTRCERPTVYLELDDIADAPPGRARGLHERTSHGAPSGDMMSAMPRSPKVMMSIVDRSLPELTRRECAALAVALVRRAGLQDPDVRSLERNMEDEFAMATQENPGPVRAGLIRSRLG